MTSTETQELFSMLGARFSENIRAMRDHAETLQHAANVLEEAWGRWDLADLETGGMISASERTELEAYFTAQTEPYPKE